ncbi:hypothetical protein [Glutamicibacter uratoxydans]|uniref:hypothetical protein n=1 Tax=Glutamicibacter uratoxydans TaxID=43667 RepID=UPI003D6DDACB
MTAPAARDYLLQAAVPGDSFSAVKLPQGLKKPTGGLSFFTKLFGQKTDALQVQSAEVPPQIVVRSHHGSLTVLDEGKKDQNLSFVCRSTKSQVSGTATPEGTRFSIQEFHDALAALPDGESLWDCVYTANPKSRVSFRVKTPSERKPRNNYLYPWFWMVNDQVAAKGKAYWTKDSRLAVKIVKKGL